MKFTVYICFGNLSFLDLFVLELVEGAEQTDGQTNPLP